MDIESFFLLEIVLWNAFLRLSIDFSLQCLVCCICLSYPFQPNISKSHCKPGPWVFIMSQNQNIDACLIWTFLGSNANKRKDGKFVELPRNAGRMSDTDPKCRCVRVLSCLSKAIWCEGSLFRWQDHFTWRCCKRMSKPSLGELVLNTQDHFREMLRRSLPSLKINVSRTWIRCHVKERPINS